jgi:hypothetical protein
MRHPALYLGFATNLCGLGPGCPFLSVGFGILVCRETPECAKS